MSKRIKIILPERKQRLREQLKAGYLANADENLRIAAEWFPLEEEAWQRLRPGPRAENK